MLVRFDPFRQVERLTDEAWGSRRPRSRTMPIDVYRAGDEFVALLDLPGVDPDSIDLTVDKHVLAVKAERRDSRTEGSQPVVSERVVGSFSRQLYLGDGVDLDQVKASYENGVLKVTIPVAEKAKPRKVEVTVSAPEATLPTPETTDSDEPATQVVNAA